MALKSVIFGSTSMVALMLAGAAQAQTVPDSAAAPQADDEVNEIVVTGVRASIVGALNVRRESTQIVDSIVSEDVGKLPDNNVVEALQRVTGIQVTDRAGGETATITIRGLTDPLTTLNGRNIFTAAGTSFALQDISANLVSRVDVYKTRSADQLETGLAGQIDVQTRRPLDFDGFTISGLARGIYSELADKVNPNVALLVSDRWETGIGDIGILVNASFTRAEYRNQNLQAGAMVPFATENPPEGSGLTPLQRIFPGDRNQNWTPGLDAGLPTAPGSTLNINGVETPYYLSRDAVIASDLYGKRERPSINAALQWAPNDSSVYTAEVFYTGFRGETFNSLHFSFADWWGDLPADVANSFELYDGTNIIKSRRMGSVAGFNSGDMATNRTDSYVYALNAKWDVGSQGKISADVAYQDSKNETSFFAIRTDRGPLDLDVDFNAGGGLPAYSFGNQDVLTDASQWTVGNLFDSGTKNTGSALTLMLDGEYKWDEGFLRRIKAGFRYDDRKADSFVRDQGAGGLGVTLDAFGEGTPFTNSGFFDGRADIPTSWVLADPRSMNKDAVRQLYRAVEPGLLLSDQMTFGRVFSINESNLAAYILADGEL